MLRRISFVFLLLFSMIAQAVTPVYNTIAMSYATMTVYQQIVLSTAQKAGGTFTFSVKAMDGGGRGPPNYPQDVANISMQFYNSSGTLIGTASSNNSTVFNTFNTYTVSTANCGGAGCANVYFMRINMTGNDGGYWAGNNGTNFKEPTLTFAPTGGTATASNLIYNPEFGVYGTYATNSAPHGWWNSTNAWGGNTHPQVINYSGTVNAANGGYLVQGGTLSGTVGGYPATSTDPTTVGTTSGITTAQQTRKNTLITNRNSVSGNSIYIDQAGDNNTINITQSNSNNSIQGINQQRALLKGDSNTVTIKQGNSSDPTGQNLIKLEMNTSSNNNQIKLYQGYNSDGTMNYSDSDGHIISLGLTGSNNQINLYQTNLGGTNAGHFAELNVTGSTNNITVNQKGNGSKTFFSTVAGSSNTVSVLQDGVGQDYLNVNLTGNGHTVNASQDGTGNHLGYIDLTNGGGSSTVNLTQSGSTAQNYSITQTCVNPAGCSVSVTQP